ncbi:MAG: PilZ domain-containing protein [Oscillospiraceae bacterium]|nr:PilZ domain-containing protein [Oscillospiraceae bacterium]
MSALVADYTGNTVFIYSTDGVHLLSTVIKEHNKSAKQIELNSYPPALKVNDECKLLILSSPTPCEFMGKIQKVAGSPYIGMFQGQEREGRGATRYTIAAPALITTLFIDGKSHPLQTPIAVTLINMSTSGIRFRAPFYTLDVDDEFEMHFIINNIRKKITAKVINSMDNQSNSTDYGCLFMMVE